MANQDTTKPLYLWAGLGISFGAGVGLLISLLGWGADALAQGIGIGAGIGLVVGASCDAIGARRREDQDGTRPDSPSQ